ncbi:MAG: ribonuclease III [Desulfovibrio sp.]|nr:ribonuclease III [Desulfovibrio sp.]
MDKTGVKGLADALAFIEEKFGYRFRNPHLLERALTHSSRANESGRSEWHNERQEFLGDAVLELCLSEYLYIRFPDAREGELTRMRARLASGENLFALARELGLDQYVRLGAGEEKQGGRGRQSVVSDALEAALGAIYEDGGYDAARQSVGKIFSGQWPRQPLKKQKRDHKSLLQQICQNLYRAAPVYALENASGAEHARIFEVSVRLPDGRKFRASNTGRKKAEQDAAAEAIAVLKRENP